MSEVVSLRCVLSSLAAMALVVATVPMAAVADEVGKEDVGSPTEAIATASSSDGSVSGAEGSETEDTITGDAASAEQEVQPTASSKEGLEGGLAWSLGSPTRRPRQMIKSDNAGMYALRLSDRQAYLLGECVGYSRSSLARSSNAVLVPVANGLNAVSYRVGTLS